MNLFEKLLDIQTSIDVFVKDGKNQTDKYDFVSNNAVLNVIRPKMNELKLLLILATTEGRLHEGTTKSGTTRFMTELDILFTWVDCESGEKLEVPFYAQGVDLAGEKGVGKAVTYAEKYFLLKFFHVPTDKDDPDSDGRTGTGEKSQRGTQAAKESLDMQKSAITQILNEIYGASDEKKKAAIVYMTKNDSRGYAGVDDIEKVSSMAIPVVYAKLKTEYQKRTGKEFEYKATEENNNAD